MAFGVKTNERPGTRASVHHVRVSAYKAREVLDLIRGKHVVDADGILALTERGVAPIVRKVLASAVANALNNDDQEADNLFVSACFADEGPTMKRWRPRARGRATRIRKRTCHITVIVNSLSDEALRLREIKDAARAARGGGRRGAAGTAEARRRRVAGSRQNKPDAESSEATKAATGDETDDVVVEEPSSADEAVETDAVVADTTTDETEEGATPDADDAAATEPSTDEADEADVADETTEGESATTDKKDED